jgi:hypothetical protein
MCQRCDACRLRIGPDDIDRRAGPRGRSMSGCGPHAERNRRRGGECRRHIAATRPRQSSRSSPRHPQSTEAAHAIAGDVPRVRCDIESATSDRVCPTPNQNAAHLHTELEVRSTVMGSDILTRGEDREVRTREGAFAETREGLEEVHSIWAALAVATHPIAVAQQVLAQPTGVPA